MPARWPNDATNAGASPGERSKLIEKKSILAGGHHPAVEHYLNVKENRKGNPDRKITLEGLFEITTALRLGVTLTEFFFSPELTVTPETKRLVEDLTSKPLGLFEVSARVFQKLSDREEPDGVAALALFPVRTWPPPAVPRKMAVLDGLEIPGNAGTILRSADGAGLDAVVFINRKVRLTHPKLVHSSLGACFSVPIYETDFEPLKAFLQANAYRILLGDAKGPASSELRSQPEKPFCLVIGGEKKSFDTAWYEVAHEKVKIPMRGSIDSLNAACAATVLFYSLTE